MRVDVCALIGCRLPVLVRVGMCARALSSVHTMVSEITERNTSLKRVFLAALLAQKGTGQML